MLKIPPPKYPRRRKRELKKPAAVPPPPPPPPPPPGPLEVVDVVDITPSEGALSLRCVFNTSEDDWLVNAEFDYNKWACRYGNVRYVGSGVTLDDFNQISVFFSEEEAESGFDELVYTNDPSDIVDTLGRELAAFSRAL